MPFSNTLRNILIEGGEPLPAAHLFRPEHGMRERLGMPTPSTTKSWRRRGQRSPRRCRSRSGSTNVSWVGGSHSRTCWSGSTWADRVARVLITGMSGAGKSTLLANLTALGYPTVDTDDDDWHRPNGFWDEPRMDALLARHATVAVSGTADNQGRFYDRFEHVVYLLAPVEVLLARTAARSNNPYGRSPEDRAEIARYVAEVEPLIRRGARVELDARRPVTELARDVTRLLGPP